jgi:hypothetical protein
MPMLGPDVSFRGGADSRTSVAYALAPRDGTPDIYTKMPTKPPTYCTPGQHVWNGVRPSARARGYNKAWEKARKAYLAAHPHCVMCRKQDVVTIATVVDHIIPHKGDKRLFWAIRCHSQGSRASLRDVLDVLRG